MVNLEKIIEEEYHQDSFSGDYERQVTEYIIKEPYVVDMPLIFIKCLTKAARKILKRKENETVLIFHREKIYKFCMEGIQKIDSGFHESMPEYQVRKIEAHLYNDAGKLAKKEYEGTGDLDWLKKAYQNLRKAAEMSKKNDPKYSECAFHAAGNASYTIFQEIKKGRREYARGAKQCYQQYLSLVNKDDPIQKHFIRSVMKKISKL